MSEAMPTKTYRVVAAHLAGLVSLTSLLAAPRKQGQDSRMHRQHENSSHAPARDHSFWSALRAEFIKYIQSKDGQTETERGGFCSIAASDRQQNQKMLGLVSPSGQ
jgi:hypothetical protein